MRLFLFVCVLIICIVVLFLVQQETTKEHLFFDLHHLESENVDIVLHKPTIIDNIYDFEGYKYSHYLSTLTINGVAHVFFRRMNDTLLASNQSTMLITSADGVTFSSAVKVFDTHPQCHNFAPFQDDGLFAIGGGHSDDLNLYRSKDNGLSWVFERKLLDACFGECLDTLNVVVDGNIYARQWDGSERKVHLYKGNHYHFSNHLSISTSLKQLYTPGIFKYASDMYVGVPLLFQGEGNPSFTKVMYSKDGFYFKHFDEIWFDDPDADVARSAYVAPGIFKTDSTWYMYGLRNYAANDISMSALKLRPYGLTSAWSANGYIKVKLNCDECYANIKGYHNGVYVDSLKHKVECDTGYAKIELNDTHLFRVFCDQPQYTVIQHGEKGLVLLLSASEETVLANEYYQSIGPYMHGYTIITYSLPYDSSLEEWSKRSMTDVIAANNKMIEMIATDYLVRPLILSGISRGGYLAAMYPHADSYYLFAPVMDWNQLSEWKGKVHQSLPPLPSFHHNKSYYVYSSTNDDRVNGTFVIEYVQNECSWCTLKIGNSGHSVPIPIFKDAVS